MVRRRRSVVWLHTVVSVRYWTNCFDGILNGCQVKYKQKRKGYAQVGHTIIFAALPHTVGV